MKRHFQDQEQDDDKDNDNEKIKRHRPAKTLREIPNELKLLATASDATVSSLLVSDVFDIIIIDYCEFDDALKLFVLISGKQILWHKLLCHHDRRIRKAIERDFEVDNVFFQHLKNTKSIIAGGYILDQLIGRPYDGKGDIDIYMENAQKTEAPTDELSTYLWKEKMKIDTDMHGYGNLANRGVLYVRNFLTQFQIIYLTIPIKPFIHNFDFEFCTSMFDGDQLEIPFPVSIMNRTGIQRNHPNGCGGGRVDKTHGLDIIGRCSKYQKRGFTIPNYRDSKTIRIPCYKRSNKESLSSTNLRFKWDRNIQGTRYLSELIESGYEIIYCHSDYPDIIVRKNYYDRPCRNTLESELNDKLTYQKCDLIVI